MTSGSFWPLQDSLPHDVYSIYNGSVADGSQNIVPDNIWISFPYFKKELKSIAAVVNSALSQQSKSLSSISTSIQKGLDTYFAQLQPFFEELNSSFANSIIANNNRSELLWCKQSLYSRLLNTSYRSLDLFNAAVCMAFDLSDQVGAFYPESVDYLLRETLKDVLGEQTEEERLLINWLNESKSLHIEIQSALSKHATLGNERKPLLKAWANVVLSGETTNLVIETGID